MPARACAPRPDRTSSGAGAELPVRVLVTRPEPGCSATAARLAALGLEPVLLPLTRIEPTGAALPAGPFDAVMATSANAIRIAEKEGIARLLDLPLFAVGPATGAAARQAGFSQVIEGRGDADALAGEIIGSTGRSARLLYLAGQTRLSAAEARLRAAGLSVVVAETYRTVTVELGPGELSTRLDGREVDFVLLYSRLAAKAVSQALLDPADGVLVEGSAFLCISAGVADALPPVLRANARIATEPNEEALFNLIGLWR